MIALSTPAKEAIKTSLATIIAYANALQLITALLWPRSSRGDPEEASTALAATQQQLYRSYLWLVGSSATIANGLMDLYQRTSGFGHLLIVSYDAANERELWEQSLWLLSEAALSRCRSSKRLASTNAGEQP